MGITCEDVLSTKICTKLREAAKKLKVKVEMIDKIIREAVAKGITKAKEIIKLVRQKIVDLATNFKCEDALPATVCNKFREIAAKLKIKKIIEEIKKHFFPTEFMIEENEITCEEILAE